MDTLSALIGCAIVIGLIYAIAKGIMDCKNMTPSERQALLERQRERSGQRRDVKYAVKEERKAYISQNKNLGIPMCPKCKSTSITYLQKKGLSGGIIAPVGKVGLMVGASTNPKHGYCKCLNCGKTWKI